MPNTTRKTLYLASAGIVVLLLGCGPRKRDREGNYVPAEGARGVPEWVTKGSAAFADGKKDRVFYAVGAVSGIRSYSLLRRASEDKARVEMANVFDSLVRTLAKSYAQSAGNFTATQEEQLVQEATKAYTNVTLRGVEIRDHYHDKPTQTMYSLARLDLKVFKDAIRKAENLNVEFKDYLDGNADRAFEEAGK